MEQKVISILFLGGAKRVSMARFFKRAAAALGYRTRLYSYENATNVPIAAEAKVIVGLRWGDPKIYDHLSALVEQLGISLIVPFLDGSVAVAAEMARRHPGKVFAPASTPEQAVFMFDKVEAAKAFAEAGLPIPPTYCGGPIDKPLIAKPRYGSASKGLINIDCEEDLKELPKTIPYLVQERIDGRQEFTVDCYVSMSTGEPLAIVPRMRLEVQGGEVTRTETVIDPEVYDLAKQALAKLGLRGAVTVQILRDLDSGRVMIMEINPRLGGGAVCAIHAEADLPRLIIEDALGLNPKPVCYRPYTEIARYPQEVAFFN